MSIVRFKGNKSGIQLVLASEAAFGELLVEIRAKLDSSKDFFTSDIAVRILWEGHDFSVQQVKQLKELLAGYGLKWNDNSIMEKPVIPNKSERKLPEQPAKKVEIDGYEAPAMIINKTLRSGTRIIYDGIVVLFGDMNPGSEIVAGRDIVIYGTCRGLVHAGAFGDKSARIIASKLKPVQIRISDVIARAPDGGEWPEQGGIADVAFVDENVLTIKPMGRH